MKSARAFTSAATNSVRLQNFDERLLRDVHGADGLHALFALLLLFEELPLAGDVAAVAFRRHIFAHRADGFTGDDLSADRPLDCHGVKLRGDDFLELRRERAAAGFGLVAM